MPQKLKSKPKQKSIDEKVNKLIGLFNRLQNEYISKSVAILNKIIDLRKSENPDYSISDLENEEGLEQHRDKIRPFLRYNNVSDKVKEYFYQGKLSSSTVFLIANLGHEARKYENQDKIADMLVGGDLDDDDLIGKEYILLKRIGGNPMDEIEKVFLTTIYTLKSIADVMEENKALMKSRRGKRLLREYFPILHRKVKEILK